MWKSLLLILVLVGLIRTFVESADGQQQKTKKSTKPAGNTAGSPAGNTAGSKSSDSAGEKTSKSSTSKDKKAQKAETTTESDYNDEDLIDAILFAIMTDIKEMRQPTTEVIMTKVSLTLVTTLETDNLGRALQKVLPKLRKVNPHMLVLHMALIVQQHELDNFLVDVKKHLPKTELPLIMAQLIARLEAVDLLPCIIDVVSELHLNITDVVREVTEWMPVSELVSFLAEVAVRLPFINRDDLMAAVVKVIQSKAETHQHKMEKRFKDIPVPEEPIDIDKIIDDSDSYENVWAEDQTCDDSEDGEGSCSKP